MRQTFQAVLWLMSLVVFSSSVALAQGTMPPQNAPSDEQETKRAARRAEVDAWFKLTRISDLDKRIEALTKWMAEHPTDSLNSATKKEIFHAVIKKHPHQKARILALVDEYITLPAGESETDRYDVVASALLEAGLYLDEAEHFIRQALVLHQREKYMERTRARYKEEGWPLPSEEALAEDYTWIRALYLTTLGRIELKKGQLAAAEKTLTEAYLSATNPNAAMGLAEIAEKKGDDAAAFEYLMSVVFNAHVPKDIPDRLAVLYRKTHDGSLDGFEAMLDKKYHEAFSLEVEHYKPTASRSNRVVLAELFTGTACPPCVGADLAFDGLLERYQRSEVAVLVYHLLIPEPDPMANPSTIARADFYGVEAVPTHIIDSHLEVGGGNRANAKELYSKLRAEVEKRLETPADAILKLSASLDGSVVKVTATVDQIKTPSENLKLHIALAENLLKYVGENGVRFHPMVVRNMAGTAASGFAVDASKATTVEHTFDVAQISADLKTYLDDFEANPPGRYEIFFEKFREKKHAIDPKNLSAVAFVQDMKSKQILQAASVNVEPALTNTKL